MRLNRLLVEASLVAGLALLALITWRALGWLGDAAPAASALLILAAVLLAFVLLGVLVRAWFATKTDIGRAAAMADARGDLHDELSSAAWFLAHPQATDWIDAQLARAGATVRKLQLEALVPLRAPAPAVGALLLGALLLIALWAAAPLRVAPAQIPQAQAGEAAAAGIEHLRRMAAALPDSPVARKLEAALRTLERPDATPAERRQAAVQAQEAIEQMKIEAVSKRENLQRLSEMLRDQPGMKAVAEALAAGDARRAADMLAQIEQQQAKAASDKTPEPADAKAGDKSLAQALQAATESTGGAESQAPSQDAMKAAIDRLNEIARELQAANYVNEAWQQVKGPQMAADRSSGVTSGRFAEQTQASSTPSPGTGETPMGGGTMFRSAAVSEGKARTQQEAGTRAGDAMGDAPPDPLLGGHAERLEAQLKRAGISGAEQEGKPEDQPWFYKESQAQPAVISARAMQARERFADAQASSNTGISIEHRQIVKDYFMKLREGAR